MIRLGDVHDVLPNEVCLGSRPTPLPGVTYKVHLL
jgi:hypothetical protein